MKRILFLFFLFPFLLSAQNATADSLKLTLKNAHDDTTKIKLSLALGETIYTNEPGGAKDLWTDAVKLCEKNLNSVSSAVLKTFYLKNYAEALNNVGVAYKHLGDIPKALENYEKCLKIQEEIKDRSGIAYSLTNIGRIYDSQGNISKALEYYHRSLKIQEEIKDKEGIALSLNNLGFIYMNQNDIPKALECYNRSLKIQEEIKDQRGMAYSLSDIGIVYNRTGNNVKALEYYNRGLKIMEEARDKRGIANILNNIGIAYKHQGEIIKALEVYIKSLKIQEEIKDKPAITNSLNNIGDLLLKQGKLSEAFTYAYQSLQTAKELGFPMSIRRAATTLKAIYKKQNKFNEALEMYELEVQMRDSISNAETKKASIKTQLKYEYEKRAAADSVKNAEGQKVKDAQLAAQTASLKQEKFQRYSLIAGLLIVLVGLGFVVNRFRITQKQKKIIEEQKLKVDEAFDKLHEKNKEVMDSIYYARRIQHALITSEKYFEKNLNKLNRLKAGP